MTCSPRRGDQVGLLSSSPLSTSLPSSQRGTAGPRVLTHLCFWWGDSPIWWLLQEQACWPAAHARGSVASQETGGLAGGWQPADPAPGSQQGQRLPWGWHVRLNTAGHLQLSTKFIFSPPAAFQGLNSPLSGRHQRLLITARSQSSPTSGHSASCSQRSSPTAGSRIQVRISPQLSSRRARTPAHARAHPPACTCPAARTHAPCRPIWLPSPPAHGGFDHFPRHVAQKPPRVLEAVWGVCVCV